MSHGARSYTTPSRHRYDLDTRPANMSEAGRRAFRLAVFIEQCGHGMDELQHQYDMGYMPGAPGWAWAVDQLLGTDKQNALCALLEAGRSDLARDVLKELFG